MILKEYIDKCTWAELKTTRGAKEYMRHSLADLKRIEPKYTDDTPKYSIHFSENIPDEACNDGKVYAKYDAFVLEEGYEGRIGVFESAWDEMLPLEVKIETGQTLSDNEIVVSVIWELTWMGPTAEECAKAWDEYFRKHHDSEVI
ncbi:MAG: hypothetical protein LBP56_05010 [Odoribacteraceae bacterium]|jgi:hypothetical protein|nr:hypothetical protein [Odoribacteraceae bacterium]